MSQNIGADPAKKLAGLQIDLLQKIRSGNITMNHLEWFNNLTRDQRDSLSKITVLLSEKMASKPEVPVKPAIKPIDHVIDFDAPPMIPNGWEVRESDQIATRFRGKWTFNQKGLFPYLSKKQKQGKVIEGNDLKDDLAGETVMGAQLLDFYLANPHLIPDEWKGKYTFFWGTIYRYAGGDLYVRCLDWNGDGWYWLYRWLDYDFGGTDPALLANQP